MQTDRRNHGVVGGQSRTTMRAEEERTWSVLSHLSMFLNLFTGFLGPVAALIIWLVYKDRSSRVAFNALQSMWFQIGWLVQLYPTPRYVVLGPWSPGGGYHAIGSTRRWSMQDPGCERRRIGLPRSRMNKPHLIKVVQ
jgi:hypothetical protein